MSTKSEAQELVKKMQNANPHIRKSKEEGISSALVAVEYILRELKNYPGSDEDLIWWDSVRIDLINF